MVQVSPEHYPLSMSFPKVLPTKHILFYEEGKSLHPDEVRSGYKEILSQYDHLSPRELHRLGLMIFGCHTEADNAATFRPRDDGVLQGVDLYISRENLTDALTETDWDGGRVSTRENPLEFTPYRYDPLTGIINFYDEPIFSALPYPAIKPFAGPYYLRTNRKGQESRLCLNPNPNCYSNCAWCARTYPQRRKLNDLANYQMIPPDVLMETVLNDPYITSDRNLAHIEEISLVTGDFARNSIITQGEYFSQIIQSAKKYGFTGSWYYSGNQIVSGDDISLLSDLNLPGTFAYTLEHFSRRKELMPVKGLTSLQEIYDILKKVREIPNVNVAYTYVI